MCFDLINKHGVTEGNKLLDAVVTAYIKLGILCPDLEIDFQANNIAYDLNGNIKLFDIRKLG